MSTESENVANPGSDSIKKRSSPSLYKAIRFVLLGLAIIFIVASLPIGWHTLELANQEYLHIWKSRRAIYDLEINGSPVSIAAAVRYGTATVLIQWALAAVLILVAQLIAKKMRPSND